MQILDSKCKSFFFMRVGLYFFKTLVQTRLREKKFCTEKTWACIKKASNRINNNFSGQWVSSSESHYIIFFFPLCEIAFYKSSWYDWSSFKTNLLSCERWLRPSKENIHEYFTTYKIKKKIGYRKGVINIYAYPCVNKLWIWFNIEMSLTSFP